MRPGLRFVGSRCEWTRTPLWAPAVYAEKIEGLPDKPGKSRDIMGILEHFPRRQVLCRKRNFSQFMSRLKLHNMV
jgi:hypothetical protein